MFDDQYYDVAKWIARDCIFVDKQKDLSLMLSLVSVRGAYEHVLRPLLNSGDIPQNFNVESCLLNYFKECTNDAWIIYDSMMVDENQKPLLKKYLQNIEHMKYQTIHFNVTFVLYYSDINSFNKMKLKQPEIFQDDNIW